MPWLTGMEVPRKLRECLASSRHMTCCWKNGRVWKCDYKDGLKNEYRDILFKQAERRRKSLPDLSWHRLNYSGKTDLAGPSTSVVTEGNGRGCQFPRVPGCSIQANLIVWLLHWKLVHGFPLPLGWNPSYFTGPARLPAYPLATVCLSLLCLAANDFFQFLNVIVLSLVSQSELLQFFLLQTHIRPLMVHSLYDVWCAYLFQVSADMPLTEESSLTMQLSPKLAHHRGEVRSPSHVSHSSLYDWHLDILGLRCSGPLVHRFFFLMNTVNIFSLWFS